MPKNTNPIRSIFSATPTPNIKLDEKRLDPKNPKLIVTISILFFVILGIFSGIFLIDSAETVIETESKPDVSNQTNTGIVKKATSTEYTHTLIATDGRVMAYLTATDDKLIVSEERKITIIGREIRRINGVPLLQVDELIFK